MPNTFLERLSSTTVATKAVLFPLTTSAHSEGKSLSRVRLFATPLTGPWDSPGQNTGVGSLFPSPEGLPNPGIEPRSPALQADSLPAEPQAK